MTNCHEELLSASHLWALPVEGGRFKHFRCHPATLLKLKLNNFFFLTKKKNSIEMSPNEAFLINLKKKKMSEMRQLIITRLWAVRQKKIWNRTCTLLTNKNKIITESGRLKIFLNLVLCKKFFSNFTLNFLSKSRWVKIFFLVCHFLSPHFLQIFFKI